MTVHPREFAELILRLDSYAVGPPEEPTRKMTDAHHQAGLGVGIHYEGPTGIHWSDGEAHTVKQYHAMIAAGRIKND